MSELFLLLLFISLGIKFRASCEERELRNLKHQHHWNMIQYQGQGRIGILALHGFGVCPQLFNPWLSKWRQHGWSYRIPMLTGSVKSIYEFENSRWQDWEQRALRAYDELSATHEKVFIVGFSKGGLTAIRVAQLRKPSCIVLLAPFFALASPFGSLGEWLLSSIENWPSGIFIPNKNLDCSNLKGVQTLFRFRHSPLRAVVELLKFRDEVVNGGRVECPIFWSHSIKDHVASYSASLDTVLNLSSDIHRVSLKDSFHYILHDVESELLEHKVIEFLLHQARFDQKVTGDTYSQP